MGLPHVLKALDGLGGEGGHEGAHADVQAGEDDATLHKRCTPSEVLGVSLREFERLGSFGDD
eukprot:667765-Alexandrium_andersonii.AAC.1